MKTKFVLIVFVISFISTALCVGMILRYSWVNDSLTSMQLMKTLPNTYIVLAISIILMYISSFIHRITKK